MTFELCNTTLPPCPPNHLIQKTTTQKAGQHFVSAPLTANTSSSAPRTRACRNRPAEKKNSARPSSSSTLTAHRKVAGAPTNLGRVLLDAYSRRHEGQKIYLRQAAAQRWIEWRDQILQGGRPNSRNRAALQACDVHLRTVGALAEIPLLSFC